MWVQVLESVKSARVLITGGAGFIGSHLADELMLRRSKVTVLDNLSNGSIKNIEKWLENPNFTFMRRDLLDAHSLEMALEGSEIVFHLAANAEVRTGTTQPKIHYKQNIQTTFNLLEAMRKAGDIEVVVFTSSSTVYGEPTRMPTPENYAPLRPISVYGSSKLSCEALITGYANTYGFKAIIYRLANVIGPRSTHGVVYDFVQKLERDCTQLEVLGDGTQKKSYLFIDDCITAIDAGLKNTEDRVEIFNIGSDDQIDVKTIANAVIEEMGLENVTLRFAEDVDGGRGWVGDVKSMLLDISRLRSKDWRPRYNSEQSVRLTVREILRGL